MKNLLGKTPNVGRFFECFAAEELHCNYSMDRLGASTVEISMFDVKKPMGFHWFPVDFTH
jgi:hypothetical protein